MRESIGRYRILRPLGEGGMGVVYAAEDERLRRTVAIKMLHGTRDPLARERLWREARAAASVNHPNVCQVYEVDEEDGELFLAMEMLEGESLATVIGRGPLAVDEALTAILGVLAALEALHRCGIVHRDLKPSNVFVTQHGVKLLDFGLARPLVQGMLTETAASPLTQTGMIVGTPRYMSPEQWSGQEVSPASDLFAVGAILFEMLSGSPAFAGNTPVEVYHAIVYEQPPVLSGGVGIIAVDALIRSALAKDPADRPESAAMMARSVRSLLLTLDAAEVARVRTTTRLMVLPFRSLRPDQETDFLTFSLPDAVTASLSGFESLLVRSSLAAARFANDAPDLRAIATEAEVDAVVTGTLLRAGDQVRVSTQLVEAPAGTLLWSQTTQVPLTDLFQLQDSLAKQIVSSLAIQFSSREEGSPQADVPATPRAYEFYLRANQLAHDFPTMPVARDLYQSCLKEDPRYAPAWARYARVCRVMGKYGIERPEENLAEAARGFEMALQLNPDLSIAHNLYTHFEVEELGRSKEAMVRLLQRATTRPTDPELYAALVVALRFCGLNEASLAAHHRAERLDPNLRTSVAYTYLAMGDYERASKTDPERTHFAEYYALTVAGRESEALAIGKKLQFINRIDREVMDATLAALERQRDKCVQASQGLLNSHFHDPEGIFLMIRNLVRVEDYALAISTLNRVVDAGFYCLSSLSHDPWLDPLRADPQFHTIVQRLEVLIRDAGRAYEDAGGEKLLGVPAR